jgi:two-component system chemotaxis sensor kinase CheA
MRVSEERIDTFLRLVGELLVVADMLGHIDRRVRGMAGAGGVARDLRRALDTFNALSGQLQAAIMTVRKVPARPLLQKVPRLVRDIAAGSGRRIAAEVAGEDTEIDKRLLDLLDAPLLHLVRNACDHGIESPERRTAAGKSAEGLVRVALTAGAASVTLVVEDDGCGIDPERIRQAARRQGLIPAGSHPDDGESLQLIFASGLTTAERVSEVSGRGVGLDAVKRDVEAVGGTVTVSSRRGEGTRFAITVPKQATTQIIGGYLVRAGGQLLVLPLERVRETFRADPGAISILPGGGRMIQRHGRLLPVVGLADRLGLAAGAARALVVVECRRRPLAVEVESVVGVQKVVVRPLVGLPPSTLVAGAALMGDGSAALILAPDGLIDGAPHA